jgi:glycerol-3-phosphate dehydrogenase
VSVLPGSLKHAPHYDIVVIGGGINGAAIAREASLRGFSVVLFEREDLCSGTSAAATRLIHGGLRYLEHAEFGLVYESLHDRESLLQTAGHLVEPIPFNIPIYSDARRGRWQIAIGLTLYDLLSWRKSLPWHRMLSSQALLEKLPGLRADGLKGGACYFDAQITWPERLVVELCADAAAGGAVIRNHCPVRQIIAEGGRAWGVEYAEARGVGRVSGDVIVNAAGPWVDRIAVGHATQRLIGGTRGSHIVVEPAAGLPEQAVYVEAASDGRPFFIVPWNGLLLIGTTDVRYDGDPANVTITADEQSWLLEETRRLFPQAGPFEQKVCYGYAGIRPLPYRSEGAPGAITRRHLVHAHTRAQRLYSVIGGKLTTHRSLAQDVMRAIRKCLPRPPRSSPIVARALPGMLDAVERAALEAELSGRFNARLAGRLLRIYGATANDILAIAREAPEFAMVLGPRSNVLVAELEYAFGAQWARTITDVMQRRCMAGLGRDRGLADAELTARWLVRLGRMDRDESIEQLAAYRAWLRFHRPVAIKDSLSISARQARK